MRYASKVALAVAIALRDLHAMVPCVVHRDLNENSILVSCAGSLADSPISAAIVDPAMATLVEGDQFSFNLRGTGRGDCLSPELVVRRGLLLATPIETAEEGYHTLEAEVAQNQTTQEYPQALMEAMIHPPQKSDVFSLGQYFYRLFGFEFRHTFWDGCKTQQDPLSLEELELVRFSRQLSSLYDEGEFDHCPELKLTASMLHIDPEKRPTMQQVVAALSPAPVKRFSAATVQLLTGESDS